MSSPASIPPSRCTSGSSRRLISSTGTTTSTGSRASWRARADAGIIGEMIALAPELLLRAYAAGIFPMAETAEDPDVFWVDPEQRGILPLDGFHLPRRLARTLRQDVFDVR